MNLNTLFSLVNLFQLRGIRSDLAKLTNQPPPMPETDCSPELYVSGGIQGPPPMPEVFQCRFTEEEWQARMRNPALSEQERRAILNDYLAEKAMKLMAEATPETVRRMTRYAAEMRKLQEEEETEAAIRRLEQKFNGPQ